MPIKKYPIVMFLACLLAPVLPAAQVRRPAVQNTKKVQRWGINTAFLVQNSPLREFSFFENNMWYAQGYQAWMGGSAGLGLSVGFSYDITYANRGMFRIQFQLESTGWITGVFDLGGGMRIPLKKGVLASIEGYFSFGQSGGTLARLTDHSDTRTLYAAFFGFKFRAAFEFSIGRNWYAAPYISYAAYPWSVGNVDSLHINGLRMGSITDSLQFGVEFGQKF